MPSLKDIKSRIGSVKSTQKITKAMKMISTARLTKAKNRLEIQKEYSQAIQSISNSVLSQNFEDELDLPQFLSNFTNKTSKKNTLTILIATDKGLCGALNTFLFKEFNASFSGGNLMAIGKKAFDFTKGKLPILNNSPYFSGKVENHDAIVSDIIAVIKKENITNLQIIFPQFISTMVQKPKVVLFPENKSEVATHFEIEGSVVELAQISLEEAIRSMIYEGFAQLICSEHSARMIAMDNASNNATAKIKELTLIYNKTRQANITREILEIVAGSQAV